MYGVKCKAEKMSMWKEEDRYQVGRPTDSLWVQHDDLSGDVSLYGLRHVLHRAVDGRILNLEPVVRVPTNQEPHVFLPI